MSGKKEGGFVIFGAGDWGNWSINFLPKKKISVRAFCDNNKEMWGEQIDGIEVMALEDIREKCLNVSFVVCAVRHGEGIKMQLLKEGIDEKRIYVMDSFTVNYVKNV